MARPKGQQTEKRLYPTRDWFTKAGADELALKIRNYWAARGYDVETQVIAIKSDRDTWHTVRSDMINGMPVRRMQILAAA